MLLGAQTFTIRSFTQSERDFRESMRRVAAIGYKSVQLSAIGPIDPHTVRDICDENGLKIVLTHTPEARILNETEQVIREHEILGCDYIGLGAMSDRYRSAAWVDRFAVDFTPAAQMIADAGKLLMYHNHNFEFARLRDGRRIIDVLLEQMPPHLMGFTADTYWLQAAGCDVCDWLERLDGRIPCVHFKDMAVQGFTPCFAAVGRGNLPFEKILHTLERLGGTKYVLVEQDDCFGESPFDCLQQSYQYLMRLGADLK